VTKNTKDLDKQLAQVNPDDVAFITAYKSNKGIVTTLHNIILCNTHTEEVTFSVCVDIDGDTYGKPTALHWDQPIPALTTVNLEKNIYMDVEYAGTVGVKQSVADAVTFMFNGMEKV